MTYEAQQVAERLHTARVARGLSQRELSSMAGVPQAQISRIEAGAVDLRLSSLAALAHALDLELVLVPRKAVPTVRSLSREILSRNRRETAAIQKEMRRISETMRRLQIDAPELEGLDGLRKSLTDLDRFQDRIPDPESLRRIRMALNRIRKPGRGPDAVAQGRSAIGALRDTLMHGAPARDTEDVPRPVYALDEDDDA